MLLSTITVGKVSMNIDFQENEILPLLHGALQLFRAWMNTFFVFDLFHSSHFHLFLSRAFSHCFPIVFPSSPELILHSFLCQLSKYLISRGYEMFYRSIKLKWTQPVGTTHKNKWIKRAIFDLYIFHLTGNVICNL